MKLIRNIIAGIVALMTVSFAGAQTLYKIESAISGKVLDVIDMSQDALAGIQQYSYWGGLNQQWTVEDAGDGYVMIRNAYSCMAVSVFYGSQDDCAQIGQYPYWGGDDQKWLVEDGGDGTVVFRNKSSGKVIDLPYGSMDDCVQIWQYSYWGGDMQKWRLIPVGQCAPVTSDSITTSSSPVVGSSYEVYANNVQNARRVIFPTWTNANGQDELIWYEGEYDAANNRWKRKVELSEHNNESGEYTTHVYAYGSNGGWFWVGATNVNVTYSVNHPPVASISVVGLSPGATVAPGRVITVHYSASDADGNLSGIRYNIWNSTTNYFDNGGGGFVSQSGSSGDVVKDFTLNTEGVWYVWTDAQDASGSYVSTGDWTNGFKIIVSTPPPPPRVESVTFSANPVTTSTYEIYAIVHNATSVQLPTWADGHNAVWYEGTPMGNDLWKCTVKAIDQNYASGAYFTDVYATGLNGQTTNLGRYSVQVNIPRGYITIGTAVNYSNGSSYSQINFEINDIGFGGIVGGSVRYNQVDNPPGFEDTFYTISNVGTGQGYVTWQLEETHAKASGSYYIKSLIIARYIRLENRWEVTKIVSDQAGPWPLNYMTVQDFTYSTMYPQQIAWTYLVQKWDYNAPRISGTFTVPTQPLQ